jgi:ribonuclease E
VTDGHDEGVVSAAEPRATSGPVGRGPATATGDEADHPRIGDRRPAPRPRIGDSRPARPEAPPSPLPTEPPTLPDWLKEAPSESEARPDRGDGASEDAGEAGSGRSRSGRRRRRRGGRGRGGVGSETEAATAEERETGVDVGEERPSGRKTGRQRNGRPLGRYLMCVHVRPHATQIAVLEGRSLIEHYVSRPQDDTTEIDGNVYLGRVQNVLPGMEAAFVDIGTPKNAVLYRGDVRYDREDVIEGSQGSSARIEQLLRPGQTIVCQVTKNPIGTKGARLTQEVSLPGRFVVLVPNSDTYGISKRLGDSERRRLRKVLDDVRQVGHGLIVRTAAEGASSAELRGDVARLLSQWAEIDASARGSSAPSLLYAEPDISMRVIREEFNRDFRGVIIDDAELFEKVRAYVESISPELADRVELYEMSSDTLPLFERHHVHEQLHKALDRKVWLPSGGSIIIERTEALTVIDVNTGKNVGTSNLEETVFRNNQEAAEEIARQLRLRDIGGIIVIDFIDMEIRSNRDQVTKVFRDALARDKTRTQVFDISELGLVQMTRKRVSEGLVESFSQTCPSCNGRGIVFDETLL